MDIGSCVVASYPAVNICGFLPFEIRFEPKMEDFEGYQMIHSAIQLKQSIVVRIDTLNTGKLLNGFSIISFFFSFHLIGLCYSVIG